MKKEHGGGFAIIGLGRFGLALARKLADAGEEVMVIDSDENKLRQVRSHVKDAFRLGKLTKEALEDTGIGACGTAVVCIGERIDVSLLTTLNVLNLGVSRVIAKRSEERRVGKECRSGHIYMGKRYAGKRTVLNTA